MGGMDFGGGMPTSHTLALKREHYNIARRFMVDNDLPNPRDAVVKMIEIAAAAHSATSKEGSNADPIPRKDQ